MALRRDLVGVSYVLLAVLLAAAQLGLLIPFPVNVVLTSVLVIYIGCHLSTEVSAEDAAEDETMSLKDAAWFPIIGSVALGSLYLVSVPGSTPPVHRRLTSRMASFPPCRPSSSWALNG